VALSNEELSKDEIIRRLRKDVAELENAAQMQFRADLAADAMRRRADSLSQLVRDIEREWDAEGRRRGRR
jgi:hypothetical protein